MLRWTDGLYFLAKSRSGRPDNWAVRDEPDNAGAEPGSEGALRHGQHTSYHDSLREISYDAFRQVARQSKADLDEMDKEVSSSTHFKYYHSISCILYLDCGE